MIELDFNMLRGDSHIINCTVLDVDDTPFDFSGCTLWFTAKSSIGDADSHATFQLSTATTGITYDDDDPTQGLFTIEIFPENTIELTTDAVLVCDIQLLDANDRVFTLGKGTLTVLEDVTNRYA